MHLRVPFSEVDVASHLAHGLHAGQVDKAGQPYIAHPAGVVGLLVTGERYAQLNRKQKTVARAAAWLHDVVEDCGVSPVWLAEHGISCRTALIVSLLTRRRGVTAEEYYQAIAPSKIATAVKIADMTHNALPDRLRLLDRPTRERLEVKYSKGFALLERFECAANVR